MIVKKYSRVRPVVVFFQNGAGPSFVVVVLNPYPLSMNPDPQAWFRWYTPAGIRQKIGCLALLECAATLQPGKGLNTFFTVLFFCCCHYKSGKMHFSPVPLLKTSFQ